MILVITDKIYQLVELNAVVSNIIRTLAMPDLEKNYERSQNKTVCVIVQSFYDLTKIKLQQKWFLLKIFLKSLPNNISKVCQKSDFGKYIC